MEEFNLKEFKLLGFSKLNDVAFLFLERLKVRKASSNELEPVEPKPTSMDEKYKRYLEWKNRVEYIRGRNLSDEYRNYFNYETSLNTPTKQFLSYSGLNSKLKEEGIVFEKILKPKPMKEPRIIKPKILQPKGKVGRPKKIIDEVKIKKPIGRPKKIITEPQEKKSRGRPKKIIPESIEEAEQK